MVLDGTAVCLGSGFEAYGLLQLFKARFGFVQLLVGQFTGSNVPTVGASGGVFGVAGEDEDIRAFTLSFDEAMEGVAAGEIDNAPAILSLLWLARHRDRLRAAWG